MQQHSTEPKCWHNPARISTEVTNIGGKAVIKATILLGGMTITSFSDEVHECVEHPISEYKQQAIQRAMHLVPQS